MSTWTLGELAAHVGGRVHGDPQAKIRRAATLESASTGDITFLANRKYTRQLRTTRASAVVVKEESASPAHLLIVDDPYYAFTQLVVHMYGHRRHPATGVSPKAAIAASASVGRDTHIQDFVTVSDKVRIGERCILYPGVFIGPETTIDDDCVLYPNVVIYERCRIGRRVIIQANATVGEDGFGYATHEGRHHKIPHIGRVVIKDDVELGAGCAIERGAFDDTVIGQGCKIGDCVVIGHGTRVGDHCLLVAQVGIAGSTELGHHCVAAGQAGIGGHLKIGSGVVIGGQSGVTGDVPDGQTLFGLPAVDAKKAKRAYVLIQSLPDMYKSIRSLTKRLDKAERSRDK
jgi:UDP-3-O-[3-hydroxymyristoyl] glucosamine N-acyltransferase